MIMIKLIIWLGYLKEIPTADISIMLERFKMSRYSKVINKDEFIAFGHDHLEGYFFQHFKEGEDGEDDLIVDESSLFTMMSNEKMVKLLVKYDCSQDIIKKVELDLPF